jgi:hypothetical protein
LKFAPEMVDYNVLANAGRHPMRRALDTWPKHIGMVARIMRALTNEN